MARKPSHACSWMLALVLSAGLLLNARAAENLPVLKATVGSPVIQELMGGCSLRCAFPWTTTALAAGQPPQGIRVLDDADATTYWIDPSATVGTRIVCDFPRHLAAELEGTPFYGFDLASGVVHPLAEFKDYARLRKAVLSYNGKPLYTVLFADSPKWQHVSFDDIYAKGGDSFSLEIVEVYPGAKHSNVALTELILQGAH